MAPRKHPDSLENWDLFVLRHRNTANVAVHLVSFLLFWISPVLAWAVSPFWLVGFFASGLVGTAGHYFFKDGTVDAREATSSLQVVHYSSVMAGLFVTGRWSREIRVTEAKYRDFVAGRIGSVADPELFAKLGEANA
jgi:hypothetical protein